METEKEILQLLLSEHMFYTRQDLATHTRSTHLLCQFCSNRFYDNDELFKHLRREHYYCHFCDADGYNFYYNSYEELRIHFGLEHWLCEEENCMKSYLRPFGGRRLT